ncbi:MAG: hypothetical protein R3247_05980, partial [Rhodothermales bacterium]|nr:hypothetical protein [Rhodothermales bacterium]
MLAFLALLLVLLYTVNQQQYILEAEREVASIELEVMAQAMGEEEMQLLSTFPFDAYTKNGVPQDATVNDLTPTGQFGDNNDCRTGACTDLDDFHTMLPDTVFFDAGTDADGNPLRFAFEIHADVTYIDEDGDPTGARTWVKQVTL